MDDSYDHTEIHGLLLFMKMKCVWCIWGLALALSGSLWGQVNLTLIPYGATWKYLDNGSNQGTAWISPTFDDASWAAGPGELGFGDGGEATVITRGPSASYITFYFRHAFHLSNAGAISAMQLSLRRDDGAVVYLNGTEVFRSNMPTGPINYLTTTSVADDDGDEIFTSVVSPAALVSGDNVLAVEIHQSGSNSSDVSFDFQLTAEATAGPPLIITQPVSTSVVEGGDVNFTVVAVGQPPLTYQWVFNDDDIPNETNPTLVIDGATTNEAGYYFVRVRNGLGVVASDVAELTVSEAGSGVLDDFEPGIDLTQWSPFPGLVLATNYGGSVSGRNSLWFGDGQVREATTRPVNTSAGGTISFYLRISNGPGSPWETADLPSEGIFFEYSVNGGANWQNLGTYDTQLYNEWTPLRLVIPPAAASPATLFRWRQENFSGDVFDHWALDDVIISVGPAPPTIFQEPVGQTGVVGGTAFFSVQASGTLPLAYQWDHDGSAIPGQTGPNLVLTGLTMADAGSYRVRVSNSLGEAISVKVTLTVLDLGGDNFLVGDLTTAHPVVREHSAVTGSDRGGIGISSTHVFYTGWGPNFSTPVTGRFPAVDFVGGSSVGRAYDAMVSDLRTETLYTLGNGNTPLPNTGGTVTTLLQIDGNTGALTGGQIPLSTAIPMLGNFGNNGLFSGFGRIAVYNGTAVFVINTGTGQVVELGALALPQHQSCNTWAFWGMLESFNGTFHLVYVRTPTLIVRTRVPDGTTSVVSEFPATSNGLGNMCGFTASIPRSRWFFHYQGNALFGNRDQTIGSADAVLFYDQPNTAPVIAATPAEQSTVEGQDVRLDVQAFGTQPLSYQWFYNGTPVTGETGSTLQLNAVQSNQSGAYHVVVSNAFGEATSVPVALTVRAALGTVGFYFDNAFTLPNFEASIIRAGFTPVRITDIAAFDLSSVEMLLLYEEGATPSYTLVKRMPDIERWVNAGGKLLVHDLVLGATNPRSDLLMPGLSGVPVVRLFGDDIDVTPPGGAPLANGSYGRILNSTLDTDEAVAFTGCIPMASLPSNGISLLEVGTNSNLSIGFQYGLGGGFAYFSTIPIGYLISQIGEPFDSFSNIYLPNLLEAFHGLNASGVPVVGSQPQNQTVLAGSPVTMSIASSGALPLTFQWYFNNAAIPGATDPILVLPAVSSTDAGQYHVVIANALGSATSQHGTLTVHALTGDAFKIASLGSSNPIKVEHNAITGGDQGGIAVTSEKVLYTGLNATAAFNITDLGNATSTGTSFEALVGNVRTDSAFLLGQNGTPINEAGGEVTELLELDDETGGLTGNGIHLSTPIPIPAFNLGAPTEQVGIFAGYDRIVVYSENRGYHISLPSGQVSDLGLIVPPRHTVSSTWAYWGVVEFFDGALHLATVRDRQNIVRTRVPDGTVATIAEFSNLGSTAMFTVSPAQSRWFFHYTGSSQFGNGNQSLASASAVMEYTIQPEPPAIRSHPANKAVFAGADVTLRVRATGMEPLRYQWQYNGSDLVNETNSTLVLDDVTSAMSGQYQVSVANDLGSATSDAATLSIRSAAPFKILELLTTNSRVVEHNAVTGDDHGGLAISSTQVFYTGDSRTGRFSASDLSGGTGLTQVYDGLVSDLATETLYSFAIGGAPLVNRACCDPIILDSLIEMDGASGLPTSRRINLSTPISCAYELGSTDGTGFFSGVGQVVVHTGSRVYAIDLPSGNVLDLGPMPVPNHGNSESWAYWGVAELFDGAIHLVYAGPLFQNQIRRTRVPDGLTTTVTTFQDLGDVSCITVSPSRSRWYFHNESGNQFTPGSLDEVMGYADAVLDIDRPPAITTIPLRFITEDTTTGPMAFSVHDDYSPGSSLVFSVASTNETLVLPHGIVIVPTDATGTNYTVTVTPEPNLFGNTFIIIGARDQRGNTGYMQFGVGVRSANDAPVFLKGPDVSAADTAGPQSLANWATGISSGPPNEANQTLTFQVSNDNNGLFAAQPALNANGTLTFTPNLAVSGTATVTVRLMDNGGTTSGGRNLSDPQTFLIAVQSSNRPPTATPADLSLLEDQTWNGQLAGTDPDGNPLTFSVATPPPVGTLMLQPNGMFSYVPAPNYNGVASFVFRVHDGTVASGDAAVTITIAAVNDPPSFLKGADVTVDEDAGPQSMAGWATALSAGPLDESGQALSFVVTTDQSALFTAGPALSPNGLLTFTPAANASGNATLRVVLRDNGGTANGGADASAEQTFNVTIRPLNDAPQFTKGPDQQVNEDAGPQIVPNWATAISGGAGAESSQALHFEVVADNPSLFAASPTLSVAGELRFTSAANAFGSTVVRVILRDDGGTANGGVDASAAQNFTLTIRPLNDAPLFTKGPNLEVDEDAGEQVVPNWATGIGAGAGAESGQALHFEIVADNPGLFAAGPVLNADGDMQYRPAADAFGSTVVRVVLRDDGGTANGGVDASAAQTFTLNIRPVNDPPAFTKGPDVIISEDAGPQVLPNWATGLRAGPANENGQTLRFSATANPNGLFEVAPLLDETGTLRFVPAANAYGVATVSLTLVDNGGTERAGRNQSDTVTFLVRIEAVNDAPVALSQSLVTREDTTLMIVLAGTDLDGDNLGYVVTSYTAHGDLDGLGGQRSYRPGPDFTGTDRFRFKVNDGHVDSAEVEVIIQVVPANDPPVGRIEVGPLTALSSVSAYPVILASNNREAMVVLDGRGSYDPEGDALTFQWMEAGGTTPFGAGSVVTNLMAVGWHEVALVVDDGKDTSITTIGFEIITPGQGVEELILRVNESTLSGYNKRPLLATLKATAASFDRNNLRSAVNQLAAFQNKVRAQVASRNSELAATWIALAQEIIDAVGGK